MRWIYFDERNPTEAAEHAAYLTRIDAWWAAFAEKVEALDAHFGNRGPKWNLPAWMHEHLSAIHPSLMWEFGRAIQGLGHRLAITPESESHLRPMVQTILSRAPEIPGWEFYGYRPVEDLGAAKQIVQVRTQSDLKGILASISIGKHNRIDITFHFPHHGSFDEQRARQATFVAAETLLGEKVLDEWIGSINAVMQSKPSLMSKIVGRSSMLKTVGLPLERFKPSVDGLIGSIVDQLRPLPYSQHIAVPQAADQPIGYTFSLKPKPAADYPGCTDIAIASASEQSVWIAMHADPNFYSNRYSRHGETFCCLKIDGSDKTFQERFDARSEVQAVLVDLLPNEKVGAVLGGGTGLRYTYIDLSLADISAALPVLRGCLRNVHAPQRSWLQFFDATLAQEWIGIYDDSPTPPGMS